MNTRIVVALALVGLFFSCQSQPEQRQETSQIPAGFVSYGAEISQEEAVKVEDLSAMLADHESVNVKLAGEIEETCAMKGCWMTVKNELGESLRVTFKDYGFFVPKEGVEGKETVFEGVLTKETLSVEEQRHYAEDAGRSAAEVAAITEPSEVYSFVASGVLIEGEELQN